MTVYAIVLAFLFLPASYQDNENIAVLSSTYVIDEAERFDMILVRKNALKKIKKYDLLYVVSAKAEIFCVDRGLSLLEVAFEAYYDYGDLKTESGFGPMDLERKGYSLIDFSYDNEHETYCIIVKQMNTERIIVAFRGTSSKRHWNDNLNYTKKPIDFSDFPVNFAEIGNKLLLWFISCTFYNLDVS